MSNRSRKKAPAFLNARGLRPWRFLFFVFSYFSSSSPFFFHPGIKVIDPLLFLSLQVFSFWGIAFGAWPLVALGFRGPWAFGTLGFWGSGLSGPWAFGGLGLSGALGFWGPWSFGLPGLWAASASGCLGFGLPGLWPALAWPAGLVGEWAND